MLSENQKRSLIALALGGAGFLAGGKSWTGFWVGAILAGTYLVSSHEANSYTNRIRKI